MAHAILIKGGGGAISSDELTAASAYVLEGQTYVGLDTDDEVGIGTMPHLTNKSNIDHSSNNSAPVILGDAAYVSINSDDVTRVQIRYNGEAGYIVPNTLIGISQSDVAVAGGLTAAKVIGGQTAFGITGTALNDATISGNDKMLSGVVAYGKNGTKYTGSIASQGAVTFTPSNVAQYGNYKGKYMTGNITVSAVANLTAANILKGKTVGGVAGTATSDATAAANRIMNGYTAYVNGSKITGTVNVQTVVSFSAAPYSDTQITFTWKNPAKGAFSGVIIVGKTGSYPTSVNDGTRYYKGIGNNSSPNGTSTQVVSGFTQGTTYYFRAFAYAVKDNDEWVGSSFTANTTTKPKGHQIFTSSGTFTVPANVTSIDIFCVGGGGAGGDYYVANSDSSAGNGGGGGGGYTATKLGHSVTPGQTFTVTIGAGGTVTTNSSGGTGGTTSFGSVLSANGGSGGEENSGGTDGGAGGSGGGGASGSGSYAVYGKGGSDGSDGYGTAKIGSDFYGGTGQGTTTRAFGESSNTLYAGGGGAYNGTSSGGAGAGGDGGGGAGRVAGTANTGGGGGGNGERFAAASSAKGTAGAGGSGICIVRWGY